MPKEKLLSEYEKGRIDAFLTDGYKLSQISKTINRTRCVIQNYINDRSGYGSQRFHGRAKALSARDERRLGRAMSNSTLGVRRAKPELDLDAFKSSVHRALQRNSNLV